MKNLLFIFLIFTFLSFAHQQEISDSHTITENSVNKTEQQVKSKPRIITMPDWLVKSTLSNAPDYIQGLINYFKMYDNGVVIPSLHRLILVGPPGSGKTTLAMTIGRLFSERMQFIPVSSIMGYYRNQTATQLKDYLQKAMSDGEKKVIIIDELDKIFEHYGYEKSDDGMNASTFWLALDEIEKSHPEIFIIGTMNDASKLPPQIKSRFHGKIVTINSPSKEQCLEAFKNIVKFDRLITVEENVTDSFIYSLLARIKNCSLRDIQLLIDTAKVVKLIEPNTYRSTWSMKLGKSHLKKALDIILRENKDWQESFFSRNYSTMRKASMVVSLALSSCALYQIIYERLKLIYSWTPSILKVCVASNDNK